MYYILISLYFIHVATFNQDICIMTETLQFLNEFGVDALSKKNIKVARIESKNVWVLNYEQVESSKDGFRKQHPINRQCRNLIVRDQPWRIVSQSFRRFFNWGEDVEETKNMIEQMEKGKVTAREKFDGSLITVTHFDGQWNIFTRGAEADGNPFRGMGSSFGTAENDTSTFGSRVRQHVNMNELDTGI